MAAHNAAKWPTALSTARIAGYVAQAHIVAEPMV
jgi:hypothetical protein